MIPTRMMHAATTRPPAAAALRVVDLGGRRWTSNQSKEGSSLLGLPKPSRVRVGNKEHSKKKQQAPRKKKGPPSFAGRANVRKDNPLLPLKQQFNYDLMRHWKMQEVSGAKLVLAVCLYENFPYVDTLLLVDPSIYKADENKHFVKSQDVNANLGWSEGGLTHMLDFYEGKTRPDCLLVGVVGSDSIFCPKITCTQDTISWKSKGNKENSREVVLDAHEFQKLLLPHRQDIEKTHDYFLYELERMAMQRILYNRDESDSMRAADIFDEPEWQSMWETWDASAGPRADAVELQENFQFSNRQVALSREMHMHPRESRLRRQGPPPRGAL